VTIIHVLPYDSARHARPAARLKGDDALTTTDPHRARRVVYVRQRVVCLLAAGAVGLAASANGERPLLAVLLAVASLALGALAVPRWHGRAPVSWIGTATRFLSRERHEVRRADQLPFVANNAFVAPIDVSGTLVGAIADRHGLAAIIEVGDPTSLVVTGGMTVPAPGDLAGAPTSDDPAVTVQTLVVRRGQFQRSFVAVRVGGDGVAWTDMHLRHALSGAVRGIVRRLAHAGVTARPLALAEASNALEWSVAAGSVPANATIDETWSHLQIGGAQHVTVRIDLRPPVATPERLEVLMGAGTAVVALSIAEHHLFLRLAAATPVALASAVAATMAACPGTVTQLDGEQRAGLTATLPLGHADLPANRVGAAATARPTTPAAGEFGGRVDGKRGGSHRLDAKTIDNNRRGGLTALVSAGTLTFPGAGLLLGHDRRGAPVRLQLDPSRTTSVRLAIVGGTTAPRVLSDRLRALATGPGGAADVPVAVAVLERLSPADSATLASADVVVCQPLSQPEAALVASALGVTQAGEWLSRIEGDMIAIISDGAVRWAQLSAHAGNQRRMTA
jgi:Putative type VII ESX secretion system translocon, EccE